MTSGFFFLFETLEAFDAYAADNGIDVVNMSFFTDPWWAKLPGQLRRYPAGADRAVLRWSISSNDALDYAFAHGVTPRSPLRGTERTGISALRRSMRSAPDLPPGNERVQEIDNRALCGSHRRQPRDFRSVRST